MAWIRSPTEARMHSRAGTRNTPGTPNQPTPRAVGDAADRGGEPNRGDVERGRHADPVWVQVLGHGDADRAENRPHRRVDDGRRNQRQLPATMKPRFAPAPSNTLTTTSRSDRMAAAPALAQRMPCRVIGASAELAEEFPHVADQEVGCFHRGEVAAAAELGPMHDVVVALGEGPDGGVAGKHRHRGRYR